MRVNEKQIARLFGLALGGLLTAGLVLSAMALDHHAPQLGLVE